MRLFGIFKKNEINTNSTTDNGILGPTYFNELTDHIQHADKLLPHEWRRMLKTPSGQTNFKIKFYGKLHESYPNLIVGTDFGPPLVCAIDESTGKEILLFDGCKHGYNAMFCDTFSDEQIKNRSARTFYKDHEGKDTFEIVISTYNQVNYDDELSAQVDENGFIKLINGSKMEFEKAKRNAFDTLQILATNENGKIWEILSEELA